MMDKETEAQSTRMWYSADIKDSKSKILVFFNNNIH